MMVRMVCVCVNGSMLSLALLLLMGSQAFLMVFLILIALVALKVFLVPEPFGVLAGIFVSME